MLGTTKDGPSELLPGEQVKWHGAPGRGIRFQGTDALAIPGSLLWAGFAVFWVATAAKNGAPWFFVAWGVPFVIVGSYISVGRFFADAYRRKHTHYLLTERRAIVVTTRPLRRVRSVYLASLEEIQLVGERNGAGSLIFGSRAVAGRGTPASPRFEWIDEVRKVYALALEAQAAE